MTPKDMLERPIVDTHAHIFKTGMPVSPGGWIAPGAPRTVEDYVAELDAHGIPFGVIAAMSAFGDYNDYTMEALSKYKRLRGTGVAGPDIGMADLKLARDAGICGMRFMLLRTEMPDFKAFVWQRLLTRLSDLGMHIHVLIEPERLATFLDVAIDFPHLRIVIDHFGFPDVAKGVACPGFQAALSAADTGRVWIKMAAFHRMKDTAPQYAETLLRRVGTDRVIWGTDWPFLAAQGAYRFEEALRSFQDSVPDPRQRREISETALRFYFFD